MPHKRPTDVVDVLYGHRSGAWVVVTVPPEVEAPAAFFAGHVGGRVTLARLGTCAQVLADVMNRRGLTQREMAGLIDIDQADISRCIVEKKTVFQVLAIPAIVRTYFSLGETHD